MRRLTPFCIALQTLGRSLYATKAKNTTPRKGLSPKKGKEPSKSKKTTRGRKDNGKSVTKKATTSSQESLSSFSTMEQPPRVSDSGSNIGGSRTSSEANEHHIKNTEHLALAVKYQRTPQTDPEYTSHRAKSLLHYWLYLVGSRSYTPEILDGIIGNDFCANFKFSRVLSQVKDSKELIAFLHDRAKNIKYRHRTFYNYVVKPLPGGRFDVRADFQENGVNLEGNGYETYSRHHWVMSNNPTEPFPRFEQCEIVNIMPEYFTGWADLSPQPNNELPAGQPEQRKMPEIDYEKKNMAHAALAQYHRWYQIYERDFNEQRIQNQLSILSDNVLIESQAGVTSGKDNYRTRLDAFRGWRNAHNIRQTAVQVEPEGVLRLTAKILYQNVRSGNDGKEVSDAYNIDYQMFLKAAEETGKLPLITHVKLQPEGKVEPVPPFDDAYAMNRAKSLMYYWLFLIGTKSLTSQILEALIGTNFCANFKKSFQVIPTRNVKDATEVVEFYSEVFRGVTKLHREPLNFTAELLADGKTIDVHFDVIEVGVMVSGDHYRKETHHHWMLSNNPDEPFPRFEQCSIVAK